MICIAIGADYRRLNISLMINGTNHTAMQHQLTLLFIQYLFIKTYVGYINED